MGKHAEKLKKSWIFILLILAIAFAISAYGVFILAIWKFWPFLKTPLLLIVSILVSVYVVMLIKELFLGNAVNSVDSEGVYR